MMRMTMESIKGEMKPNWIERNEATTPARMAALQRR